MANRFRGRQFLAKRGWLAARAFLQSVDGWEAMAQLGVPVEEGEGEEPDQFE